MTNLVYGPLLLSSQLSLRIDCFCFEEVANFVSRSEKVIVTDMIILAGSEFSLNGKTE